MPENQRYLPEGFRPPVEYSHTSLQDAMQEQSILEATVVRCDAMHNLWLDLGGIEGYLPREEGISPLVVGAEREISILSCVGRKICFVVTGKESVGDGSVRYLLSRKQAQEQAIAFLQSLPNGAILRCRATHLTDFGVFVDIGCGVVSLLPLDRFSMAKVSHGGERFVVGESLLALLIGKTENRFFLSRKELLGTWLENAAGFTEGETVRGVIRRIEPYGIFVELTPNLVGLAEPRVGYQVGDGVAVQIRSIRPEKMKVKLWLLQKLPAVPEFSERYFYTDGILRQWCYAPEQYEGERRLKVFAP